MAKIKYAEGATPLLNEHDGYTFQPSHAGQSMFPSSRSARKRYMNQFHRMQNNQKAVTRWRHMSAATKTAWENFALTFPQPSKRDPNKFLTGYECFIKRNSFCFLNHGIREDFILEPELEVNTGEPITFEIKSSSTVIECAENYIKNFGLLPQVGDKILIYAAVYSEFSGHFYESISTSALVEEVFIDSFQVTVNVPDTFNDVTISLYLSKPVSPGVEYVGTKIRYMGCFTTKTFLGLQDTPGSYTGAGHQIVRVNITEDGLEFAEMDAGGNAFNPITVDGQDNVTADSVAEALELVAGEGITIETDNTNKQIIISAASGGGFDCDDLLECDIITGIIETISDENDTSVPKIDFGLFYTFDVISDARGLAKAGWHVPTREELETLQANLGGYDVAGGPLKDTATEYWLQPNVGATNAAKFNGRGGGSINDNNGGWQVKYDNFLFWTADFVSVYGYNAWMSRGHDNFGVGSTSRMGKGHNIRLLKNSSSLTHGENGIYIGNNGRGYRTINIHGQEYLADNLHETLFNNGDPIPQMSSEAEWEATSGPKCATFEYA